MVKFFLYPRLAVTAIRKNIRIYLPYLLACAGTVLMFNLLLTLTLDPEVSAARGGAQVQMVLMLGCVIVALFSAILLFYTNGVIIRQRKREFGLYNILGMEKRHIALVLLWETLFTAVIAFAAGVLGALVFSKLAQLILLRMLSGAASLVIRFNPFAASATLALFVVIFLLNLFKNLTVIHRARPVELLHSTHVGEREPKSRWLLAVLGLGFLIWGYVMSLRTNDVFNAIGNFFTAVILVIIGTYFCFTAFSIVLLKALRRKKSYYYKTNHFVAVSGMLYRMKRNAMGLASICILSTMVLVTASTTFSLYLGINEVIDARYPSEMALTMRYSEESTPEIREESCADIRALAGEYGLQVKNEQRFRWLYYVAGVKEDGESLSYRQSKVGLERVAGFFIMPAEDYMGLTGADVQLNPGEALVFAEKCKLGNRLDMGGITLNLIPMEKFKLPVGDTSILDEGRVCLVVDGMETLEKIYAIQKNAYVTNYSPLKETYCFDLDGDAETIMAYEQAAAEAISPYSFHKLDGRMVIYYEEYLTIYGAMFFLGMFLGLLFVMTTVTIMYYKQVSEGMEDHGRYAILQNVGMTRAEVRSNIRSQVLTVFFLPLGTAAVHVAFAFPMVVYILIAFGMKNIRLFALCTLGSFGVFTLLYIAVYLLTARAYYRIVDGRQ